MRAGPSALLGLDAACAPEVESLSVDPLAANRAAHLARAQEVRDRLAEGIATLTFDRPAVKNALNLETVQECHQALAGLAPREDVGVLIVTGAGESSFVSGADINDIRARTGADGLAAINSSLFAAIERFPRPTIAAVNG